MRTKFKKGQKVVCTHYKDRPAGIVDFVIEKSRHISGYKGPEIWVTDTKNRSWWGPPEWFKKVR